MRLKDLETSMTSVNRLFGSNITATRRIYFASLRILKLKALAAYLKKCVNTYRISDVRLINAAAVGIFVHNLDAWTESSGDVD